MNITIRYTIKYDLTSCGASCRFSESGTSDFIGASDFEESRKGRLSCTGSISIDIFL